jgi:hypothetical protein
MCLNTRQGKAPQKLVAATKPVTVEELPQVKPFHFKKSYWGLVPKGRFFTHDKAVRVVEVRDGLPGNEYGSMCGD